MTNKNWIDTPTSSNIRGFGYDPDTKELTIQFHRSRSYTYSGVGKAMWIELKDADSVGKFFALRIKDVYPFTKED